MAYTYTPSEQIDVAKRRISSNNAVAETALSSLLAMAEQTEQGVAQAQPQAATENSEKAGFFRRALETSLDWFKSVTLGLGKALEGLPDFGASIAGVIGGWAGDQDFKEAVSDLVARDFVGEWMQQLEESAEFLKFSNSYINDMSDRGQRIVRGIGEGVGQMLPLILLTAATGGAATAAEGAALTAGKGAAAAAKTAATIQKVGQVANLALLGVSAAGTGTEQALNYEIDNGDGTTKRPSLDHAFLYGLASGAVEVGTEMLVGGPYEKVFGSGVADKMINKLVKSAGFSKAVKFAINAVGEGVEEVVSEAVANTLQTLYKTDEGIKGLHWEDPNVQDMFEAGVIGAITSAVVSGGNVAVRKMSNSMSVQDYATDARNIERRLENLSAQDSLDSKTAVDLQAQYEKSMKGIVKRYNAANEKARARIWKTTPGLSQYINEDGTRRTVALETGAQEITAEQAQSPAMSQALFARANEVANDLHEHGTTIAENMSEEEIANTRKLRTALKKAGANTGTTLKVVVAEHLEGSSAFIKGDVMYISKDRVGSVATMAEDFAHETAHFAEKTREYTKLVEFLHNAGIVLNGKPTTVWALAIDQVERNTTGAGKEGGYLVSNEVIEAFKKMDKSGLTEQQLKEWELFSSEVVAKANEIVLSVNKVEGETFGEKIIADLVEEDRNLAKAWLKKIKRSIDIVKSVFKGDADKAAALKWLQKVEHTFEDALAASGEKYLRGKTGTRDDEDVGEDIFANSEQVEEHDDNIAHAFPDEDTQYSIREAKSIEAGQAEFFEVKNQNKSLSRKVFNAGLDVVREMVGTMEQYADILPQDKVGKTVVKNGSYDRSIENTTVCVRTLAYNEFVDKVQDKVGRPLTQMESFLASQMIYDIATDPQCLYCYVSLDRKAFGTFVNRYFEMRDEVIKKWNESNKTDADRKDIFKWYLENRTSKKIETPPQRKRFDMWLRLADSGERMLSLEDVKTEALKAKARESTEGSIAAQYEDMRAYAQNSSQAKIQRDYVAYRNEILKMSDSLIRTLNRHYGLRWYSFSDYSGAFIVENMQQVVDASLRGLKGLAYTKDIDFARIFAPTGMNINISVFAKQDASDGHFFIDETQSAKLQEAIELREQYPNVGIVAVATNDDGVNWALEQEWSDVVVPFHIVRTGVDVSAFYKWKNYTAEQSDRARGKKADVYPNEHQNDRDTYLRLCEERDITPRFERFLDNPNYMKLVNETRQAAGETSALLPVFDLDAAKASFDKFVEKGGYWGSWYKDGVDVDAAAEQVARDVEAGKKANEVDYGRQDIDTEALMKQRLRGVRSHGVQYSLRSSLSLETQYTHAEIEALHADAVLGLDDILSDLGVKVSTEGNKGALLDLMYKRLRRLNGDTRKSAIDKVADYIMRVAWLQDADAKNNAAAGKAVVDALRQYFGKVDLSSVRTALASDEKAQRRITSRWGAKDATMSVEQLIEKAREAGISVNETDPAKALLELDVLYEDAKSAISAAKKSAGLALDELFTKAEQAAIHDELVERLEKSLEDKGTKTKAAELIAQYEKIIAEQREAIKEGRAYNKAVNKILDYAERLKPNGRKHRSNASYLEDPTFNAVMKELGKIKYRSDIRRRGARAIFASLAQWYNKANPLLNGNVEATEAEESLNKSGGSGYLRQEIIAILDHFSQSVADNKPLSLDEVKDALMVMQHIDHLVKTYDQEVIGGQTVRVSEVAADAHAIADKYSGMRKHKLWMAEFMRKYKSYTIEPRVVIAGWFGHENSALIQCFDDITAGETKAGLVRLEMIERLEDFFKAHKKYRARLAKDKLIVHGKEITVGTALSLYMLAHQQDSIAGLQNSGWGYYDNRGYWVDCGTLTEEDVTTLDGDLSQADKDFLKVVREVLDMGGKYMAETDIKLKGFTTIVTENSDYYPIARYKGDFSQSVDQSFQQYVMNASVANLGVTKARVKNQRRIAVGDIVSILETHAKQIGDYTGLAVPIKAFQRVYNANIAEKGSTPISIRNVLNEKVWNGAGKYITNLLADIQGMNGGKTASDIFFDKMRGAYAKFQLGANIKVIFSQMASYPTAFAYLSPYAMGRAFVKKIDGKDMDKYCPWARVRNHDHTVVLAESVTDKISKVGDVLTKPIQWTDRLTISMLWNACQFEVQHRHKGDAAFKVGTEQNKTEAGELLEYVGRRTQPNYTASERSALQRSNSQVAKVFSMFSSVPLKQVSRLVEAFDREAALRYKKNVLHENVTKAEMREAHAYTVRALTAVTVANIIYVAMGQAVKFLLNKDRKDKDGNDISVLEDFFRDFLSTSVGMFPIIKEVYNALVNGFTNEDFVSSAFTNLISATRDIYDGVTLIASGDPYEDKDLAKPIRSFAYALGQVTGIPTRNVYNLVYGLIKRFDPAKAYEIDSMFTSNSVYSRDLKKAVEAGDENKATTIIGLMLKDDGMTSTTPKVNEKLRSLYAAGYSVLPRTVKDSIVYDGETIELSRRSQNAFKSVYGKANDEVEALIDSSAFSGLTDEVQAKAIKWVYDYYYEKAVYETVGAEANSKRQLFAETMAPSKFAMTIAACSAVEGKVDRKGNTVAGSKRAAVVRLLNSLSLTRAEKALILAYLGYSVSDYAGLIKRYIAQIGLSKEQQKAFFGYIS